MKPKLWDNVKKRWNQDAIKQEIKRLVGGDKSRVDGFLASLEQSASYTRQIEREIPDVTWAPWPSSTTATAGLDDMSAVARSVSTMENSIPAPTPPSRVGASGVPRRQVTEREKRDLERYSRHRDDDEQSLGPDSEGGSRRRRPGNTEYRERQARKRGLASSSPEIEGDALTTGSSSQLGASGNPRQDAIDQEMQNRGHGISKPGTRRDSSKRPRNEDKTSQKESTEKKPTTTGWDDDRDKELIAEMTTGRPSLQVEKLFHEKYGMRKSAASTRWNKIITQETHTRREKARAEIKEKKKQEEIEEIQREYGPGGRQERRR